MSQILHRREITVAITAEESGKEFACSPMDVQVEFLMGWLKATEEPGYGWCMQCRYIADEITNPVVKRNMANMLQTLVEHLEEPC